MNTRNRAHSPNRQQLSALTERLRSHSHRVTGPRRAILKILQKHPHPLTSKEILAAMSKDECDLATIYRAMHLLERIGLVNQFDFGDGFARYELVTEAREPHHHHLICRDCSRVIELDECFSQALEKRIASRHGFKAVTHRLEFFGICPECQLR